MRKSIFLIMLTIFSCFLTPVPSAIAAVPSNLIINSDRYNQPTYSVGQDKTYYNSGIKGKTIVLDPGHGGSDIGAIGVAGLKEKDITLTIAQDLRRLLESKGAKVIMTRKNDRDVAGNSAGDKQELQARVNIADRYGADLFISIHADAFEDSSAGGTTTYYFPKSEADAQLAAAIQSQLSGTLQLNDRGYRSSDFYVLDHTSIPAALVEVAFLSNPAEEKMLKNRLFLKKAAQGIFQGILNYFSY